MSDKEALAQLLLAVENMMVDIFQPTKRDKQMFKDWVDAAEDFEDGRGYTFKNRAQRLRAKMNKVRKIMEDME